MYFGKYIRSIVLFTIVAILSFSTGAHAKIIYKWSDTNGQIHITDDPPAPGKAVQIEKIEFKETHPEDTDDGSGSSIALLFDELSTILDRYGYGKTAQVRYLKQVSSSRFSDLPMSDFIGPECDLLGEILNAVGSSGLIVFLSILLLFHLFLAICFYRIIRTISLTRSKFAFVPVLNIFSLIKAAGKPAWWGALPLVPFVGIFPPFVLYPLVQLIAVLTFLLGIVLFTIVWMNISKQSGFSRWTGILILFPFAQLVLPAYLAFRSKVQPERETRIESATRELYLHLLSSKRISFETGSISTSKGPVAFKIEHFRKNKSLPSLKLRIRMVHLPNFVLESKRFCKFVIKEVITGSGENIYNREHPQEKKTANELSFKEIVVPFVHFEAVRDIWLSKEVSVEDIQSVSGELFLRLPLNIQSLKFSKDLPKEGYTNTVRVILKELRGNSGYLLFRGPTQNYVTSCAFGLKERPLVHTARSINKVDNNEYIIKETFKRKISQLQVFIADNHLEQRYPFEIKNM